MEPLQFIGRRRYFADVAASGSLQNHPCRDFEYRLRQCEDAYGYYNSKEKCRLYLEDMYECVHESKRVQRLALMHEVRNPQVAKGERGYLPMPRSDLL